MTPEPSGARNPGFTFVELLLALALGAIVAAVLAALVHGLFVAGAGQSSRVRGPFAARAALRALAREVSCAFAPPVKDLAPMGLATSSDPGQPEVRLSFFVPVPAAPPPGGYDIHQVSYEVVRVGGARRELRRIAVPCSGPRTNAPTTNLLLQGRFSLAIEALTNATPHAEWPPAKAEQPGLPSSLRLALALDGAEPLRTEALIQAAAPLRSPLERRAAEAAGK